MGVVLVFAKPLPDYDQAGGYLDQQQQPNTGEEFVVAYGGGDIPNNYKLDTSPEQLNTDPSSFGEFSNPTLTIQENPTPAEGGELVAGNWLENLYNSIFGEPQPQPQQRQPTSTGEIDYKDVPKEQNEPYVCGEASRRGCCSWDRINGKPECANISKFHNPQNYFFSFYFLSFILFFFSLSFLANEFWRKGNDCCEDL